MKTVDEKDKAGYWRRYMSLTPQGDPRKGTVISVYGEDYGLSPSVANTVFEARFVTPRDWFRMGIYEALFNALRRFEKLERQACKIKTEETIRRIREDSMQ